LTFLLLNFHIYLFLYFKKYLSALSIAKAVKCQNKGKLNQNSLKGRMEVGVEN